MMDRRHSWDVSINRVKQQFSESTRAIDTIKRDPAITNLGQVVDGGEQDALYQ